MVRTQGQRAEDERATGYRRENRTSDRKDGDDGDARRTAADLSAPGPEEGPDSPSQLGKRSLWAVAKRTVKEFQEDNLTDWAAALTYYGVLSIFPGLLVLVSVLGLVGQGTADMVVGSVTDLTPDNVDTAITGTVTSLRESQAAGVMAIVGVLGALWSSSGYIGAFMRASNAIYDVPEGRPMWKTLPIRVGVTVAVGVMLVASALIVVLTGRVAEWMGDLVGLGPTAVTVWNIAKWPVLIVLVSLIFALLYWASPNARQGGFRWVSPGGLVAVLLWLAASGGFALYLANFGSYDKTYGALAGAIIFLVWLWISNLAVLFGAELDAELERGRAMKAGHPAGDEPYLQLRDDRKVDPESADGLT